MLLENLKINLHAETLILSLAKEKKAKTFLKKLQQVQKKLASTNNVSFIDDILRAIRNLSTSSREKSSPYLNDKILISLYTSIQEALYRILQQSKQLDDLIKIFETLKHSFLHPSFKKEDKHRFSKISTLKLIQILEDHKKDLHLCMATHSLLLDLRATKFVRKRDYYIFTNILIDHLIKFKLQGQYIGHEKILTLVTDLYWQNIVSDSDFDYLKKKFTKKEENKT